MKKNNFSTINNVALSRINSTKAKTDNEKQKKELKRDILNLSNDLFKEKRINKSAYEKMFDLVLSQSRMNALEDAHNALIKIKNSEDLKVYKKDFTKLKKEEKVKREGEDKFMIMINKNKEKKLHKYHLSVKIHRKITYTSKKSGKKSTYLEPDHVRQLVGYDNLNDSRIVEASSLEEARQIYSNLINEEQTYEEYSSNALVDVDKVDFIDDSPVVSSQIQSSNPRNMPLRQASYIEYNFTKQETIYLTNENTCVIDNLVGLYGKELKLNKDDVIKINKTFHNVVEDSEPQYIESDLGDLIINPKFNDYNQLPELEEKLNFNIKQFEETHFKLMNPAVYVRIYNGKINLLKHNELLHLYNNVYCNSELFITKWIKDPEIRTYEELVYKPKQEVPDNVFNIFTGFPNEPVEGNIAPIQEVLRLLSNNDQKVFDYIEKWIAWILQRPSQKTGVCIIVQGEQGIGKDTYFDFIGNLLGEYYFNTSRAEEDVFTHFDGHLKKVLLMKFEEASFLVNKKNETALKGWITCKDKSYTNKGFDPIKLDNYFNIVMTTNSEVPVVIEQTDRRFVLIKGSSEKRGHHQFWTEIHKQLNKPELLQAYLYYLLNIDLTGFNPRESRPITEYYEEVKQSFIPYHAQFFQHYICTHCDEDNDTQSFHFRANDLLERMKQSTSFDLNKTKLGRNLKIYPDAILHRDEKRYGTDYTITSGAKMREFLISQKWWVD